MNRFWPCAIVLAFIAALAALPARAADIDIPKKLGDYEALDLVLAAIYHHKPGEPEPQLYVGDSLDSGLSDPGLPWHSPRLFYPVWLYHQDFLAADKSVHVLHRYAVNTWTGDVWDVWNCKTATWLTSPRLRMRQAEIKKRFAKQELKQYERLRGLNPGCPIA